MPHRRSGAPFGRQPARDFAYRDVLSSSEKQHDKELGQSWMKQLPGERPREIAKT
jgi:hypothetical protein